MLKPFSIAVALPVRATDFNLLKNQSQRHAKKAKCSLTPKRVRAHKSRQKRPELNTCIAKVETHSLLLHGQNDCNRKRPLLNDRSIVSPSCDGDKSDCVELSVALSHISYWTLNCIVKLLISVVEVREFDH